MKKIILFFFICCFARIQAQHFCASHKQHSAEALMQHQARTANLVPQISHELKYDIKFVHLNLNLERNTKFISGGVTTIGLVLALPLDTFMALLHQNYTIDSIRFNGVLLSYIRQDSMIKVKIPLPLVSGSTFTSIVYYNGTAPTGGAAIGSGYNTQTAAFWNNQVSWSSSEAVVAYHWWPCKQILTDKIDSSWVYVTTDSANKVGSNGILQNVVTIANKKRYEWKSRTPIAYYLISVAVTQYKEYKLYAHPLYMPNDSILIQNYIYDNAINTPWWISSQKPILDKMPKVLEFESKMYGMYPFYKEKYGHCFVPINGGMENQTMTNVGYFDYYVDVHELGHQWWGDNVTCKSWSDIWINEGFASYTQHLVAQYLDSVNFVPNLLAAQNDVMSQPGGSIYFTDTLNHSRVFDSRLTYHKGGSIIHSLRFLTNNDSLWFNTLRSFQNTYKNSTASAINFRDHYTTQTGINATQFFTQWYFGEGYPTFDIKYNFSAGVCYIKSTQSTSTPSSVPLFITPVEYKIKRSGAPDTVVRVMHSNTIENYSFAVTGTVTGLVCDPNNWIINNTIGPVPDSTLIGIRENQNDQLDIKAGPNPVRTSLNIMYSGHETLFVKLFDLGGKLVSEKTINSDCSLDMSGVANGTYQLVVTDRSGKNKYAQKVIRQ